MSCLASEGVIFCQFTTEMWILGLTAVTMVGAVIRDLIGRLFTS